MIDLIRTSQVPSNLMQSAARGSLSVPADEMIEILVYLALHHKIFGQQARMTLAGWDEKACLTAALNPATSAEVLGYWTTPDNLRIPLLAALLANHAVKDESVKELAARGGREVVTALQSSARVMNSPELVKALHANPNLQPNEIAEIARKLGTSSPVAGSTATPEPEEQDEAADSALAEYLNENAAEVETAREAPFQASGDHGHTAPESAEKTAETPAAMAPAQSEVVAGSGSLAAAAQPKKIAHESAEVKRDSVVQKIQKLDVKGRIALAVRGGKEERSILIRDMTKVVCLAVLESPKLTDTEVEGFAQQKNVLDWVLRTIPMKRRFAKNYTIQRNLAFNPRTPTDVSLGLMKNLMTQDLKNLSENKEVADPVRKLAFRFYRQKLERHKS